MSKRYELIDKNGHVVMTDSSPSLLAGLAKVRWPDQSQDPDRSGRGWDIQVCSGTPPASRASHYS